MAVGWPALQPEARGFHKHGLQSLTGPTDTAGNISPRARARSERDGAAAPVRSDDPSNEHPIHPPARLSGDSDAKEHLHARTPKLDLLGRPSSPLHQILEPPL